MKKLKQCRMCEYKFQLKEQIPEDGLCVSCHVSLCQKERGKCIRCMQLVDKLIDFIYPQKGKKMKYEITIMVDTNDGDYMTGVNEIDDKDLKKLRPLFAAIKDRHQSFNCGESTDDDYEEVYSDFKEDVLELFLNYVPSTPHGFHTVERIEICPLQKKERII